MPNGPAFDPGPKLPVSVVAVIFPLPRPARSDSGPWSPNWGLAVIHDCCECSSVIKLRNGAAGSWNLVGAGVIFIPLPMQMYPRDFSFTQKE